jgi:hypothetical protein
VAAGPVGAIGLAGAVCVIVASGLEGRERQRGNVAIGRQKRLVDVYLKKYWVGALVVRLSATCDTTGADPRPSDQPEAQRYERTGPGGSGPATTWYTVFPGGCVTVQVYSTGAADAAFATEAGSIIDFTTRQALQQALEQRSGGRLHLDPLPG